LLKRRDQKSENKQKPRINTEIAEDTEDTEIRKQKTENRKQKTENRKQKTERTMKEI